MKQDTFLILKLLIIFLNELNVSQGSFPAKCTGLILMLSKEQHYRIGSDIKLWGLLRSSS